jgi:hypothetical protein
MVMVVIMVVVVSMVVVVVVPMVVVVVVPMVVVMIMSMVVMTVSSGCIWRRFGSSGNNSTTNLWCREDSSEERSKCDEFHVWKNGKEKFVLN